MNSVRVDVPVCADVPWVCSLRVIDWSLEDAIVVVIPVELVEGAVVVVVEGVGAVAPVEALYQIDDAVVVVVEIVEVIDAVVVVVLGLGLLEEEAVTGIKSKGGWIGDLAVDGCGVVVGGVGETSLVEGELCGRLALAVACYGA